MKFGKYDIWNVKVDYEPSVLDEIRTFLKTKSLLAISR